MSTPLVKVKYVALLACLAWALSLVVAAAAPAKDDHKGPDAPPAAQHEQDKAAKDADKAQKEAEKAAEQAAKDAEKAAKDAEKAQEKAEKDTEKEAKKDKGNGKHAAPAPAIVVETIPSVVPRQEIAGQALHACTSRRLIQIRLRHPRGTKFRSATVTLNGKRIATRRGKRITAPIDLRGLSKGTYKVVIRAVTTKGKVVRGTRTYHTCVGPIAHGTPKV